jgi:hypothetical protein
VLAIAWISHYCSQSLPESVSKRQYGCELYYTPYHGWNIITACALKFWPLIAHMDLDPSSAMQAAAHKTWFQHCGRQSLPGMLTGPLPRLHKRH